MIDPQAFAQAIAEAISQSDNASEFDNLGDGESIVFTDICPTVNLVSLSEILLAKFDVAPKGVAR